jgi:hypothetical protein
MGYKVFRFCIDALGEASCVTRGYRIDMDGNDRVLTSGVASALYPSATADKARRNVGGSSLPRFSARRSIPAHALGLK